MTYCNKNVLPTSRTGLNWKGGILSLLTLSFTIRRSDTGGEVGKKRLKGEC